MSTKRHALIRLCGGTGMFGCTSFVAGDTAATLVRPSYSPIAQTMSELAAGPQAWIQELGIWLFSAGALATALGLALAQGSRSWRFGCVSMFGLAAAAALVGITVGGPSGSLGALHAQAAGAVVVTTALAAIGLAPGLWRIAPGAAWLSVGVSVGLLVLGPLFLQAPPEWRGAFERGLAAMGLAWAATVSALLMRGRISRHAAG